METSPHLENMKKWFDAIIIFKKDKTIDNNLFKQINTEKSRSRQFLYRLISAIQFLAEHDCTLRGSIDRLYQRNNGKFLGLIEMLAKFDPVIQEHVRRIVDNEIHDHYLGPRIQNELIQFIALEVRKNCFKHKYSKILFSYS